MPSIYGPIFRPVIYGISSSLARRNCLVGNGYHVKIGDIGSDNPLYERDYYEMDKHLVPIRWMAWESTLLVS